MANHRGTGMSVSGLIRGAALGITLFVGLMLAGESRADVKLPQLVGDNMVLQRDQELRIWGWASPGESVRVRFRGMSVNTRAAADGRWSTKLKPQAAGGPYEMLIAAHNTLKLSNILIGDVWVASGQSNMEFSLKEADGGAAAIGTAVDSAIRLIRLPHVASTRPQGDVLPCAWKVAAPGTVADFSAVAYLFAVQLRARYHVPIGVIESSWGGTYAESWMSAQALQPFPDYAARLQQLRSFSSKDEADYAAYVAEKAGWDREHRTEDRGTANGHPIWADPNLDTGGWAPLDLPRPDSAWGTDFDSYDGTVWYRHEISVPPEGAGKDLELHLGSAFQRVQVYYDGEQVATVSSNAGFYRVSGDRVHAGRGVIAQRLTGSSGYIMISGKSEDLYALAGGTRIPLAGPWLHRTGADLTTLPKPPALAPFYGFPGIAVHFNAMIEPLTPFHIKGVIWYQGESNVGAAELYGRLFPALIADWRSHWGADFPFLFVQLAGYSSDPADPGEAPWAELREAQQAALALPHTGMATAVDIGNAEDVHPKNKQDVALRLALVAGKVAYGEDVVASGPTFRSMQIEGKQIHVHFDHAGSGLLVKDRYGYPRGFAVAPRGGPFRWAKATVEGADVVVSSDEVPEPVAVRYGWANTPDVNLYNREGLPVIPFRSDGPHSGVIQQ